MRDAISRKDIVRLSLVIVILLSKLNQTKNMTHFSIILEAMPAAMIFVIFTSLDKSMYRLCNMSVTTEAARRQMTSTHD